MGLSKFFGTPYGSITQDAIGSSKFETIIIRTTNSSMLIVTRAVIRGEKLETNLLLLLQDDSVQRCC